MVNVSLPGPFFQEKRKSVFVAWKPDALRRVLSSNWADQSPFSPLCQTEEGAHLGVTAVMAPVSELKLTVPAGLLTIGDAVAV